MRCVSPWVFGLGAVLVWGCSSKISTGGGDGGTPVAASSDGGVAPAGQCTIAGTYTTTIQRRSGTCGPLDGEGEPGTLTITVAGNQASIAFENVPGECPAQVFGCTLTAECQLQGNDGRTLANQKSSWTFTAAGFTGTDEADVPEYWEQIPNSPCKVTYAVTGTRQ